MPSSSNGSSIPWKSLLTQPLSSSADLQSTVLRKKQLSLIYSNPGLTKWRQQTAGTRVKDDLSYSRKSFSIVFTTEHQRQPASHPY